MMPRAELQRFVDGLVVAGAPGAAAVLEHGGRVEAASGFADLQLRRAMRPSLRFRAGSLTKSFVATVVLQLVGEHQLALDDTIDRWFSRALPHAERITIRQLLGHTSGIPDYVAVLADAIHGSELDRMRAWTPDQLIGLAAGIPRRFPPGASWAYANTNYVLLGSIVERVTGDALGRQLAHRILEPLELRSTSFPVGSSTIGESMARGYAPPLGPHGTIVDGPPRDVTVLDPSWAWAAGALISTLDDLTRFFRGLLRGRLLPPALLDEMVTMVRVRPDMVPLPLLDAYGLGLVALDSPGGRLVGHPGGIPGYLSAVLSTPDGRRQLAVMINIGEVAPRAVNAAFVETLRSLAATLLT